ncbi:MAG: fibronectin type III domain-containing protein, partial [Bacteroidota bacterium]
MKTRLYTILAVFFFTGTSVGLKGQAVDLQMSSTYLCGTQVLIDIFISAADFSTDTFYLGNSSLFISYDASKMKFDSYTPDAFDPDQSQQAQDANWLSQQFDYDEDFGIFHLVLQKTDVGTNNYKFYSGGDPYKIGSLVFNFLEEGSTHSIGVNFPFTNFNDGLTNDGSKQVVLNNVPSLEITNSSNGELWSEDFGGLGDDLAEDTGSTAWSINSDSTNNGAVNYQMSTLSNRFRFRSLEGEGVWQSEWISLCGAGVGISIDMRESGTMESDDYIRAYYQIDGEAEVLIGEILDDSEDNNTYYTFSTNEITGDLVRIIVRAKNGNSGDFESHEIDNIKINSVECTQPITPQVDQVTDTSAILSWNPDFSAMSYNVQYRLQGETTWDALSNDQVFESSTDTTNLNLLDLTPNTVYEYQITTVCESEIATPTLLDDFTTNFCSDIANPLIGTSCNDEDPETTNDIYTTACACVGSLIALSVELSYLTATPEDKKIIIEWGTASELNNDFFTVEKSKDGSKWEVLAIIPG